MTTLDRINAELTILQDELSQLNHYTEEIGKSKEASSNVIEMSQKFINSFQKRIDEINIEMNNATSQFSKSCIKSSSDLDAASTLFQKGIYEARRTLEDVGAELVILAEKVNNLTSKISSIDILGHFEKIQSKLSEINHSQNDLFTNFNIKMDLMSSEIINNHKKIMFIQKISMTIVTIVFFIVIFLALKFF